MEPFVVRVVEIAPSAEGVELLEEAGFEVVGDPPEYILGLEAFDRDEAVTKARTLVAVAMNQSRRG